jgi:hypothetical protein
MIAQFKQQLDSLLLRIFLLGGFLLALFISNPARAEGTIDTERILRLLAQQSQFNSGGTLQLNREFLRYMQNGQVAPATQFIALNQVLVDAVKTVNGGSHLPTARSPYVVAKARFDQGLCIVNKAFQNALVLALVPQMSSVRENGGDNDPGVRQAKQQQALAMATAFSRMRGCDPESESSGFDQGLLSIIQNL